MRIRHHQVHSAMPSYHVTYVERRLQQGDQPPCSHKLASCSIEQPRIHSVRETSWVAVLGSMRGWEWAEAPGAGGQMICTV